MNKFKRICLVFLFGIVVFGYVLVGYIQTSKSAPIITPGTRGGSSGSGNIVGNLTPPFLPYASSSTNNLADSPLYRVNSTSIGLDGNFFWGPGTTNIIYRSGRDLIYTNGG